MMPNKLSEDQVNEIAGLMVVDEIDLESMVISESGSVYSWPVFEQYANEARIAHAQYISYEDLKDVVGDSAFSLMKKVCYVQRQEEDETTHHVWISGGEATMWDEESTFSSWIEAKGRVYSLLLAALEAEEAGVVTAVWCNGQHPGETGPETR